MTLYNVVYNFFTVWFPPETVAEYSEVFTFFGVGITLMCVVCLVRFFFGLPMSFIKKK